MIRGRYYRSGWKSLGEVHSSLTQALHVAGFVASGHLLRPFKRVPGLARTLVKGI